MVGALALLLASGAGRALAGSHPEERADKRERRIVKIVTADGQEGPRGARHVELLQAFGAGGHLGVHLAEVEADDVAKLGLDAERGARVKDVVADSPAAKAGLAEDDVIVAWQGEAVTSALQLRRLVRETPPGRKVAVEVVRGGRSEKLTVEVGGSRAERAEGDLDFNFLVPPGDASDGPRRFAWRGRPGDMDMLKGLEPLLDRARPRRLGVSYQDIEGQLARYFRLEGERGALVTEVADGSAAEKAGVKAGDVILGLGGHKVKDGADLREAIDRAAGGEELPLEVWRDGKRLELRLTLPSDARNARERRFH
jgi:predicted metalloprotease with PDZ domain